MVQQPGIMKLGVTIVDPGVALGQSSQIHLHDVFGPIFHLPPNSTSEHSAEPRIRGSVPGQPSRMLMMGRDEEQVDHGESIAGI